MAQILARLMLQDEHAVLSVLALHGMPSNALHADPVALRRAVFAVPGLTASIHTVCVDRRKPGRGTAPASNPLLSQASTRATQ